MAFFQVRVVSSANHQQSNVAGTKDVRGGKSCDWPDRQGPGQERPYLPGRRREPGRYPLSIPESLRSLNLGALCDQILLLKKLL